MARWTSIDPLAEISRRWTPYNYVENDPVRLTDPDGMETSFDGTNEYYQGADAQNYARGIQANEKKNGGGDKNQPPKKKDFTSHVRVGNRIYGYYGNGLYKPVDEGAVKDDYTFESMYIGGKILGPVFGYLGKTVLGWFGESTAVKEAIVAIGELTGKGYTAAELSELLTVKDGDLVKIIYRGITGNETKSAGLFFADEAEYAAGYASNGSTGAEALAIPEHNFQYLVKEGFIKTAQGVNSKTGQKGLEYIISNPALKQKVLDILLKTTSK